MSRVTASPLPEFNPAAGFYLYLIALKLNDSPIPFSGFILQPTPIQFRIGLPGQPDYLREIVNGSNFTYNSDANNSLSGGTVTSLTVLAGDAELFTIDGFAPQGAVTFYNSITATAQQTYEYLVSLLDDATTITGSHLDETFEVGAGQDTASTGDGNDQINKWKAGDLTWDGGLGSDTLSFQSGLGPVYPTTGTQQLIVNLSTNRGGQNPYGGTLNLTSVENVVGTDAADQITGDSQRNVIGDGLFDGGADIIHAAGGDDLVRLAPSLAAGARINGGSGGGDELRFTLFRSNTTVAGSTVLDLTNQANNTGIFEGVTITNFERFTVDTDFLTLRSFTFRGSTAAEMVTGSVFVTGTTVPNGIDSLNGGGGNDSLNGLSGDDTLKGGAGDDLLIYTSGVDVFDGGANGAAGDTASLAILATGVVIDLGLTTAQAVAGGSLRLANIEHLVTGSGNDRLNGATKAGANRLSGGAGNDTYIVGTGDTIIESPAASGGIDTVFASVTTTLVAAVENLVLLTGGANGTGNSANNTLTGNSADNVLLGLAGSDTLTGGPGADQLDGGTNTTGGDTASYAASIAGVTVDLGRATAQESTGDASGDTLIRIENLTGSAVSDSLRGTGAANRLDGGPGGDTLTGLAGNDTYVVDSASDVVDESVAGSNGLDVVVTSIAVNLGTVARIKGSVENVMLTGTGAISATGNALANMLDGSGNLAGNILRGLAGNDSVTIQVPEGATPGEASAGCPGRS